MLSLGWSAASAEGCYSTAHAAINPPPLSEKANSTQRINGREETRREDVNVGVVGHLETISNPSSQRSQDRLGTKEEDHRQT